MISYVQLSIRGFAIGYANHCMAMSDSAILDPAILDPALKALTRSWGKK